MITSFASFEVRRWVLAASLTFLVVSLQVAQAARPTNGGAAATGVDDRTSIRDRTAAPVIPVQVNGSVVATEDDLLGVHEIHAPAPVSFALGDEALLIRDGTAADAEDLRAGDRVRMTVDGRTGRILQLRADPAAAGWQTRLDTLGPLAALALVATLGLLAVRRWGTVRPAPGLLTTSAAPLHAALTRFGRRRPVPLRRQDRACGA